MGWASAGYIFDPVAQALVDLNADEATKRRVLGALIAQLQDGDWDTEFESLQRFTDDPVIVAIFAEHGVELGDSDEGEDEGSETEVDPDLARRVLDLPMDPDNDSGAGSVRGYLIALLAAVWDEGEGFSGKRPFGNSCWESDLYAPLVVAGLIPGRMYADGGVDECDDEAGRRLIDAAIQVLGEVPDA